MGYEEDKADIMAGLKSLGSITETIEKMGTQMEGQETLTQTFKQEIGDVRTSLKELGEKGVDAETIKNLVDKVDALGENTNSSSEGNAQGGTQTDKDWDEKQLSEVAKAKADEVYSQLTPEEKADIVANPSKRKQFLKAASDATEEVPASLFTEPVVKKNTTNEFRKLFGLIDKDANHMPGSSTGTSNFAGASSGINSNPAISTQKSKRLPGGVIPKGNTNKEE